MEKGYSPAEIEKKWLKVWEEAEEFKANPHSKKPSYCIVIPPPNVTGKLHMGHALVNTLQDILIRWKRMSGFETLWVPGTDHAGISTQLIVEKHLLRTEKKKKSDYTREEFLEKIEEWSAKHKNVILGQLKRLGTSCDFSREAFTLDKARSKAVRAAFKKLFDEGLIYKGNYLVNWDTSLQTALSDDEVVGEERSSFLWHFSYPLESSDGHISIATTRPETMLGDTAVAVNPKDPRYKDLIGKKVRLPLSNRLIPIIADSYVDPTFGTGVVKITPAHDHNDYQVGIRHNLPMINILTPDGKINENGGDFQGLSIKDAREAVINKMKEMGHLKKIEAHTHTVGLSERSKTVVEPYLSKQWFIKMENFKKPLREAVEKESVKILPENWKSTYFHWIDNLRDWCISRQLIWGHRIPVFYEKNNPEKMVCPEEGETPDPDLYTQDPDVLDTWFSSALWPFSTLGWPEKTPDLEKFYPNSTLVTGHDILFFWVTRMILMGTHFMKEAPFPETFMHGLIFGKSYWRERHDGSGVDYVSLEEKKEYDLGKKVPPSIHSKWEKMSKSKGNVIDPMDLIEDYGTDAMRMALAASANSARQIDLDLRRFEEYRNFANKIWNGARFVFMNIEALTAEQMSEGIDMQSLKLEDKWILSLLNRRTNEVIKDLENYSFDGAAIKSYEFFWKEFCAYYVELCKPVLFGKQGDEKEALNKRKILSIVLLHAVRLLHPMAPFITEELFATLKGKFASGSVSQNADPYTKTFFNALKARICALSTYPEPLEKNDPEIERSFTLVEEVVYAVRTIRADMGLSPNIVTDLYLSTMGEDGSTLDLVKKQEQILTALLRVSKIYYDAGKIPSGSTVLLAHLKIDIPLPAELRETEKHRLTTKRHELIDGINSLTEKLNNPDFMKKAPASFVENTRKKLAEYEAAQQEINQRLEELD